MVDIDLSGPAELWRILVPAYDMDNPGELRQSMSELGDICVAMRYSPPKRYAVVKILSDFWKRNLAIHEAEFKGNFRKCWEFFGILEQSGKQKFWFYTLIHFQGQSFSAILWILIHFDNISREENFEIFPLKFHCLEEVINIINLLQEASRVCHWVQEFEERGRGGP